MMIHLLRLVPPPYFLRIVLVCFFISTIALMPVAAQGSADLYIKDTLADDGDEPNPDPGPMWVSPDIWVRTTPDPGYRPDPFTGTTPPASWNMQAHQNAEYRSPLYSSPNYVYVMVTNRGDEPSTVNERLRVYWSKASTGLAWPTQWNDYMASNGAGGTELFGAEITEPRKNAATATQAERDAFVQAIITAVSRTHTNPTTGASVGQNFWNIQEIMHALSTVQNNAHGTPAFFPWHREMLNRLEQMLQEVDPTVNLMYWDWTTNPRTSPIPGSNPPATFNYLTSAFMGANNSTAIGLPFGTTLGSIRRNVPNQTPPADPDMDLLIVGDYQQFRQEVEFVPNHNSIHGYLNGTVSSPITAPRDPFFFLLHGNVDRLWAQWQRNPAFPGRMNRATAYGLDGNITGSLTHWTISPLNPWDGSDTNPNQAGIQTLAPWTTGGGYIRAKNPSSPSIVTPPVYDIAPLTIPILQPGQSAIIEIPWYPPNPADFAGLGADLNHFCLLARIETETAAPFGMTFTETNDVNANTRNNNNIAWKNISVVGFSGTVPVSSFLVRNIFEEEVLTELRFANAEGVEASFFNAGSIFIDLGPELLERWRGGGEAGEGIEIVDDTTIQVFSPKAALTNITLFPGEVFPVDVRFQLNPDYEVVEGPVPQWDFIQVGTPEDPQAVVGGQRFPIDFSKIVLVEAGDTWRYLDYGIEPEGEWRFPGYDDSQWLTGQAELGFGDNPVTTLESGPPGEVQTVRYFRTTFQLDDPTFIRNLLLRLKRNDGAIVYLNGGEIHRVNVSDESSRLADLDVTGLERDVFFPIGEIDPGLLNPDGENVVAVEIYLASPESQDLSFDLELYANAVQNPVSPALAVVAPAFGELFQIDQTVSIEADVFDPDGEVRLVSLYVDDEIIAEDDGAPYTFEWQANQLGVHQLRLVAVDTDGLEGVAETTISVLENTPPSVELAVIDDDGMFTLGDPIVVSVQALDDNEKITFVEVYLIDHSTFNDPQLVETVESASFETELVLPDIAPGHYSIYALAYDEAGIQGQSVSTIIMIHD